MLCRPNPTSTTCLVSPWCADPAWLRYSVGACHAWARPTILCFGPVQKAQPIWPSLVVTVRNNTRPHAALASSVSLRRFLGRAISASLMSRSGGWRSPASSSPRPTWSATASVEWIWQRASEWSYGCSKWTSKCGEWAGAAVHGVGSGQQQPAGAAGERGGMQPAALSSRSASSLVASSTPLIFFS